MYIATGKQQDVIAALTTEFGDTEKSRIESGVAQVANFWREEDGDPDLFQQFCREHFIADKEKLNQAIQRLAENFESLDGHFNQLFQDLRRPIDLDWGEITALDMLFGQYNPSAHLDDDFFANKIAFVILLNFPHFSLRQKNDSAAKWDADAWTTTRIGDLYSSRIPAAVQQNLTQTLTAANSYTNQYNIFMGQLLDEKGETHFPRELKLISHWGLRDELKAQYSSSDGLKRQQLIYRLMLRIIAQEIPDSFIDNDKLQYCPIDNTLYQSGKEVKQEQASNQRYQQLLNVFHAMQQLDEHYPNHPTHLARKFELEREMSESEVEKMFVELFESSQVRRVAELVKSRLDRELQPYDIWYDGFKPRGATSESELDKVVASRYPNLKAFESDIANILEQLGFSQNQAEFVSQRVVVDPARGAGHAWRAAMKSAKAHLRTRIPGDGMNYKGFNVAMHELGHNVEQTFTLHRTPSHFLRGVPATAFTEAFAFVFQDRDLKILRLDDGGEQRRHQVILGRFWSIYEIMGVSLVDIEVWRWLYQNPDADAAGLKQATTEIAVKIWNKYFAGILGESDSPILAIYSHMIAYPLYLADYPLGLIISLQIENYVANRNLGVEMERMCATGRVTPQEWMKRAVGAELSLKPIFDSVDRAIEAIG